MTKKVAVFGATGTAGGGAARKLVQAGFSVRGITRDVATPQSQAARAAGMEVFAADLDNRASIRAAIEGMDAVYFSGPSLLNRWDIGQAVHGINAVDAAIEVGTPHFVYQSALVGDARGVLSVGAKRAIEERIAETELSTTIVRPAWFMDNFLNFFPISEDGENLVVAMAIPVAKQNGLICAEDIGRAAVAVLSDPEKYIGKEVELVSDVASPSEMARIIGEELGRNAVTVEVPLDAIAQNWPEGYDLYKWLGTRTTIDTTNDLVDLIGEPTNFRAWARANLIPVLKAKLSSS